MATKKQLRHYQIFQYDLVPTWSGIISSPHPGHVIVSRPLHKT